MFYIRMKKNEQNLQYIEKHTNILYFIIFYSILCIILVKKEGISINAYKGIYKYK